MTTTLTCDRCGAVLRIETDDAKHCAKKQAEFEQKHTKCKKGAK